jgi:hypothetical protein
MNLAKAALELRGFYSTLKVFDGKHATHDYTFRGPGHDFIFTPINNGLKGDMSGWGLDIKQGDYLILPNNGKSTRYRVDNIKYYSNPSDMWSAQVSFCPRIEGIK